MPVVAPVWRAVYITNGSSSSSFADTPDVTIPVNDAVLVVIVKDNIGTTDADHSEVSGVADTVGNTYTKLVEYTNGEGGAGNGVTVSAWFANVTTQIESTSTITATLGSAVTQGIMHIYSIASGEALQAAADTDQVNVDAANDFGSSTLSGLTRRKRLYFRLLGKENSSTVALTPTTNFTAGSGGRSQSNAAAVSIRAEYRVNTSTGETSNPSVAVTADAASVFFALEAVALTPPTAPSNLAGTAISSTRIDLTWTDNSSDEDNFEVERGDSITWDSVSSPAANATSLSDTGLTPSTAYSYRIRAVGPDGNSDWALSSSVQTLAASGSGETGSAMFNRYLCPGAR